MFNGVTHMINLTESAVGAVRRFIDSSEKAIVGLRIKKSKAAAAPGLNTV